MSNPNNNLQIDRSLTAEIKLYYDLHAPQNSPAPLLIALHGYGSLMVLSSRQYRDFINISGSQRSPVVRCDLASAGLRIIDPKNQ